MALHFVGWLFLLLLLHSGRSSAWMDERPVLEARDGNLIISSAKDRNVTIKMIGSGYVNINEINLLQVALAAQNATRLIERLRMGYLVQVEDNLERLTNIVEGPTGLQTRIAMLEGTGRNNNSTRLPSTSTSVVRANDLVARNGVRRLNVRVERLEDRMNEIIAKLKEDDCQSNPCQNGGTCVDLYEGYQCHCPSNWEGRNCMTDVNECARYLGTDLGCQNGANCFNLPGSYRCECQAGWAGVHCTSKMSACSAQNSQELCGHGVCVPRSSSPLGYTCICDQGWESDGTNPACTKDVDECAGKHPPCSVNPAVMCVNAPGTFSCGACPRGYTGNGYYCADIDECLEDNGGCSTVPRVQCINTMGSRVCGPCPVGYQGDGVSCIYVGSCRINNGGCHPLATCVENPALTSSYVLCRCPSGYEGDGRGPNGCQVTTSASTNFCANNFCVHGTCVSTHQGYLCRCDSGFTGATCNTQIDPCSPNPCRNHGVCIVTGGVVSCDCPNTFTGSRCETPRQTCGGVLRNAVGRLEFPPPGNTYQHGLNCAWLLLTNQSLVLNVTFVAFNVENTTSCIHNFLQIHDGKNAGSQVIGRFCGKNLPNRNGNIISSHNALYLWFHSDGRRPNDGFAFHWNSIEPVCGDTLTADYGTLSSPGFPGRYPPNRDCYWYIHVREGKRIQLHFGQLMLEEHPTCSHDYVEISGIHSETLGLYCNHSQPAPLTAPANRATLHFHSDGTGQDAGFQIHYSVIESIAGCGGVLTSNSGTISSPRQSTYQININCEWKIQFPMGDKVKITWIKFDIDETANCFFDSVEIYDGANTDAPLLGRYCGESLPPTIKSSANVVLVIFRANWPSQSEEFELRYEVLCSEELHGSSGIVQSPMYPLAYHSSKVCTYEIVQAPEKSIVLQILDLDIRTSSPLTCYSAYLDIYDGDTETANQLASLCGGLNDVPSQYFYSTHNFMHLKFAAYRGFEGRGFKANYTTIDKKCGGIYKSPTGIIESPKRISSIYLDNDECTWVIIAPPGHVIQISWLAFSLEFSYGCRNNYVSIYENSTRTGGDLLGTYCGNTKPPMLTTQSRIATIIFHGDVLINSDAFTASYIFIDVSKVCGAHYTKRDGVIRSPNYPSDYPAKKECVWIIEAPNRQRISLQVEGFELETHHNCDYDYLEIRNGGYEASPLVGRYCGTEIPKTMVSQTNKLYLKFVSDRSHQYPGFSIRWDSSVEGCGGTLTSKRGDIVSPNYPEAYAANAECTWKIVVAAGNTLRFFIVDLDLEHVHKCRFDYVEIYEGTVRTQNAERYCSSAHPSIIDTKSNVVTVRFHSDITNSGRGFHIRYDTVCQNKVHGFSGIIESPNFPNKYEHSMNCSWTIEVPMGNKINLTFSHFDLESGFTNDSCKADYVEIKEGNYDKPFTKLGKFCKSSALPKIIHSSQRQVFVTFITDNSVAYNGFRLEWILDGCGGHLTKPFDSFTSPGYPSTYLRKRDCEWFIEVDHTHSVEITFHDIYMNNRYSCNLDRVEVFGGQDETAPKLVKLCHSDKPVIYTSPGNKMFVKFHADMYGMATRGFSASYRSVAIRCGGLFTANAGTIHSANYPQNYPHNQDCEWLIRVNKNHIVNVSFEDFDIEKTRNCTDDYVKIFDGPSRDNYLLGTHCGNQLPPSYVSSSNEILVVMRTDGITSAKGFKASYSEACGARIIVKDEGYLESMSSVRTNCTWILVAENLEDHITLTFTHMQFERAGAYAIFHASNSYPCRWEYVKVIEGEGLDGAVHGKWCNNEVPASITSTGNALTVHLVALADFAATYSVLNSACGGTYTSERGRIASPGYPNSYPLGSECIWILNVSPGNGMSLTFYEFDIQRSDNCDLDYLEIRENSGIGKLIGIFCGKQIDRITSSSKLWIKFRSDDEGAARGFTAQYSMLEENELEGPAGEIASPLYPRPYKRSGEFSWRVTVEYGYAIRIEFKATQVSIFCLSNVKVYDGYDKTAPLLIKQCSSVLPPPIESSGNVVYIVMHTDIIRDGFWFDLTWLQVPRTLPNKEHTEETKLSNCNYEISLTGERVYTLSSPGWPHGYEDNLECNWIFASPPGTHLAVQVAKMDLEESYDCIADYVAIYSGDALNAIQNAVLKGKLCLSNSTTTTIHAGNVMTVKFVSDSYINKTGFKLIVYKDCGGEMTGPNGVIELSNSSAPNGIRSSSCQWSITVKAGRTIEVQILDLSAIGAHNGVCGDNYIILKNGGDSTSPLLGKGKYCDGVSPLVLETTGNRLFVKASSVGPNLFFKLNYREKSMECGGEFVMSQNSYPSLNISTPNYPNIPPAHVECTWRVMSAAGERLTIHFVDRFDLTSSANCEKEYVEIVNGGTDISKSMGRFCGNSAPSSMTSTGDMMLIRFYTDVDEPKNGFRAFVTSGDVCGGILRASEGVIHSPNYPQTYPKDESCLWWVIGPVDHTLKFHFRDIHLPNRRRCDTADFVQIAEKLPENDTQINIGTYCGTQKISDVIETSTNEAIVIFQSDKNDYINFRGFVLNFTASREVCGGELTAMSGTVKSPGYPNPQLHSRYCDWRIKLPIGYQVVVDIIDLDVSDVSNGAKPKHFLTFYNDFRYRSIIGMMYQNTDISQVKSTSNTMMIGFSSTVGHRGIKFRYRAVAPAPCSGTLDDLKGEISGPVAPYNESSYFCRWIIKPPEYLLDSSNGSQLTLTVTITGTIGNEGRENTRRCSLPKYVALENVGMICGNLTSPRYLRSPTIYNELKIVNGSFSGKMNYHLTYEWQSCGGILQGPSHTIRAPNNISYPINCAWHAKYPDIGEMITMTFSKLNLGPCENSYIIVRNGGATAPQVGKFCGNLIPHNITSTTHQLWVEYYAAEGPNEFEFSLQLANHGCGSALRGASKEIASPGFPKSYPNNAECVWEMTAENGFHIGLTFVDRYSLETSDRCENDYVQVFDWVSQWIPEYAIESGNWTELGKVCGRVTPKPFNSTSNRMKVVFRSNERIQGDGFRAIWNENCGGIFEVKEQSKFISSPAYPNYYPPQLNCNYTLLSPERDIVVEFTDFLLEPQGRLGCVYDYVTVITTDVHMDTETRTWCGDNKPPILRSISRMEIIFQTDKYSQRTGFRLKYHLNECGGVITEATEIKPLMQGDEYFERLNCTWLIKAPPEKSIVLRFEKFVLEYSRACYFDSVSVYEGESLNSSSTLGTICGNLTEHLPVFTTDSGAMTVNFISDFSNHYEGFSGKIFFVDGPKAGCGGVIKLDNETPHAFRTQRGSTYKSLEDCQWTVMAPLGKHIKLTFNSVDLRNAGNGTDSRCIGDYLTVYDGPGQFSEPLGKYCGNVVPAPIMSSLNTMWIRFISDGTVEGSGVTATIQAVDSPCGPMLREANETKRILTSPGYPKLYEPNTKCRWILRHVEEYTNKRLHLRLLEFNLTDSKNCESDYLEITDSENRQYIDHGYGENYIYSGTKAHAVMFDVGDRFPFSNYRFCGEDKPFDFYSYSSEFEIKFKASTRGKGFKLEYSEATCDRNYTSDQRQGRIIHQGFSGCWITVTTLPNHTISLYFNSFSLYDDERCTKNALQIREGNFSGSVIATLCGVETPSPIFSTANKLSIHSWSKDNSYYANYDITYVTTGAGRGCGGTIFNYGGTFTSPLYPNVYRKNEVCTWDVSVPRGFKVVLEFTVFDIGNGKYCNRQKVRIYSLDSRGKRLLRNTYCGGDYPAKLETEGNRILVEYTSTVNNAGTGWVAVFTSKRALAET